MGRDQRLDFWRGLCLVDMVLVHFAFEGVRFPWLASEIFSQYTRFAAGGFVFIAGFGVGLILLPKAVGSWPARRAVYVRLWRRAAFLLAIHYLSALAFVLLNVGLGLSPRPDDLFQLCDAILLLRMMPHYGDILPLYAVLLSVTPVLNEVRRRCGWLPIALLSASLVVIGQSHPYLFSVRTGQTFPPILWQVFFIAGLAFGVRYPGYRRAPLRHRAVLCGVAWSAFALIFLCAHGPTLGLVSVPPLSLVFRKEPLTLGAIYWYFTIVFTVILTSDVLWEWRLAGRAWVAFVARLGHRSLPVYIGHVFGQTIVLKIIWRTNLPPLAQAALVAIDLAALWAVAWVRDQGVDGARHAGAAVKRWFRPPLAGRRFAPQLITTAALLGLFLAAGQVPLEPQEDAELMDAGLQNRPYIEGLSMPSNVELHTAGVEDPAAEEAAVEDVPVSTGDDTPADASDAT